jgi:hypothetical protein
MAKDEIADERARARLMRRIAAVGEWLRDKNC